MATGPSPGKVGEKEALQSSFCSGSGSSSGSIIISSAGGAGAAADGCSSSAAGDSDTDGDLPELVPGPPEGSSVDLPEPRPESEGRSEEEAEDFVEPRPLSEEGLAGGGIGSGTQAEES